MAPNSVPNQTPWWVCWRNRCTGTMTHGPTERLVPGLISGVAKSTVQPNAHQHTGCELRRRRNHTPALLLDTGSLALWAATDRKASTPTDKLSQRKRGQRLYSHILTAGPPSCFNPGLKDGVQRARHRPARYSGSRSFCGESSLGHRWKTGRAGGRVPMASVCYGFLGCKRCSDNTIATLPFLVAGSV